MPQPQAGAPAPPASHSGGFGVQFDEAIRYLEGKLPEVSLTSLDLAGPVHAKVFTVAGSTSVDLVSDLQQALVRALKNGTTITQFRKDFDAAVQDHGWAYKGKRGWRTSVIFNANMRSAHMAGRWAQIQANVQRRPFLQYRTAGDARVRPQHRAWNGLIYPVGHSFWSTHYPPCGWNCRCTVRAFSREEMGERNLSESPPFDLKLVDVRAADGTLLDRVPHGIDPGWDHNVGQSWINPELALGAKLARLPRELRGLLIDKTISPAFQIAISSRWKELQAAAKAGLLPADSAQIAGFLDSATLDALQTKVPELELRSSAVTITPGVAQSAAQIASKAWTQQLIDDLPAELRAYRAVLWDVQTQSLVVVGNGKTVRPRGGAAASQNLPTTTLHPNERTGVGMAWVIDALGIAAAADLLNPLRYRLLVGRVN